MEVWLMPMNKYLRSLIAGVVSLVPGKTQAAEPVQQQNTAIVQPAQATQNLQQKKEFVSHYLVVKS